MEHARETVYLFSGSVEKYKPFYASALIQHDAMLHLCVERGGTRYNFYGINCVFIDNETRRRAWDLLAQHLPVNKLEEMIHEIGLSESIEQCTALLEGKLRGRTVVDVDR